MSTGYNAQAGYGFKTKILLKDMFTKENASLRARIVEYLPQEAKDYYGDNLVDLFRDRFDGELIEEILAEHFPELSYQWYGNPYSYERSGDCAFILVKSTAATTDGIISMDKHQAVTASQRASLRAAAELFGSLDKPQWFL